MELKNITQELYDAGQRLKKGSEELFKLARERAEAERKYRIAHLEAIMKLKEQGERITLIPDMSRALVSEEKFERDLAEARYIAGKELLDSIRTQVSALQTILKYQEEV